MPQPTGWNVNPIRDGVMIIRFLSWKNFPVFIPVIRKLAIAIDPRSGTQGHRPTSISQGASQLPRINLVCDRQRPRRPLCKLLGVKHAVPNLGNTSYRIDTTTGLNSLLPRGDLSQQFLDLSFPLTLRLFNGNRRSGAPASASGHGDRPSDRGRRDGPERRTVPLRRRRYRGTDTGRPFETRRAMTVEDDERPKRTSAVDGSPRVGHA